MVQLELDVWVVVVVESWIGHLDPEFKLAAFEHEFSFVCQVSVKICLHEFVSVPPIH